MEFYDQLIAALNDALKEQYDGKMSRMGAACNVHPSTLKRLLEGERSKWAKMLGRIADAAGVQVSQGDQQSPIKEVCFVDYQSVQTGNEAPPPVPEDYIAVPLAAGPVAAGRGLIPDDQIQSWVLAWKHHDAVRFRTNLVAVEIGKNQTSMEPTLHPQDVLLVDRDDFKDRFNPPGNIFLVREPDDSVAVKRVTVKPKNGDMLILFYSDNSLENPPTSWSLNEDYDGDISRAVIGRVVWAWSDMSRK